MQPTSLSARTAFQLIVFFCLVGCRQALAEGLCVEQVQRDFQARYHLIKGGYLDWPKCSSRETPAPHYPKDGYYGDLSTDPEKGVELVRNLVEKFYAETTAIYGEFVKNSDALEGATHIANYSLEDFPVVSTEDVSSLNYQEILNTIALQVSKLRAISVPASEIMAPDGSDTKWTVSGVEAFWPSVRECCLATHQDPTRSWGEEM